MGDRSDSWHRLWTIGRTGWHQSGVNKNLIKHMDAFCGDNQNLQIFVPLCGKSLDMKYLYNLGHRVVGVELVEKPCRNFFAENDIKFSKMPVPKIDGTVYVSADERLKIFCCDFYKFDKDCAGLMDAIWDRCSLSAIEIQDREKYCKIMKSLMAPKCSYLLDILNYDQNFRNIPPYAMNLDEVRKNFEDGTDLKVEVLDHIFSERKGGGVVSAYGPWISTYVLLIKLKNQQM